MTKTLAAPAWQGGSAFQPRISSIVVFLYTFSILGAFAWIPVIASRWQPTNSTGFFIRYLVGICFLGSALWVFLLGRRDPPGQAFALFTSSSAFCLVSLFEAYYPNLLTPIWMAVAAVAGGALFQLAWTFPEESGWLASHPYLRHSGYLAATFLALATLASQYIAPWNKFSVSDLILVLIFLAGNGILFLIMTGVRRFHSPSPIVREQSRLILWSAGISLIPLSLWILISILDPYGIQSVSPFTSLLLLPLVVFPILVAYTLLRYRIPSINSILSRIILYGLLSILVAGAYTLIVAGASLIAGQALPGNQTLLIGLLVLFLAAGLNPLRQALQGLVDKVFFRGQSVHRERLQSFSHELTQTLKLRELVQKLREYANDGLFPKPLHIFLYDQLSDSYTATVDETGRVTTDLRYSTCSALVKTLSNQRSPLFLGWIDASTSPLRKERASLALLDAQLFIPMPGREYLVGWIALGPRRSGEPYNSPDIGYLDALCLQTALAIERAQGVTDLERRVHEMDVLARVTQGINITVEYNDLLELIYAQTNRILPGRDFRILLKSPGWEQFTYAIYVEDDERRFDLEKIPVPANYGLETEVFRSRQARMSADYERECGYCGVQPAAQGIYAWMGIPLNARSETIGVLSIGSRNPSLKYTEDQRVLLQAIADQAAGAIVKARLLQESQQRTHQLATLNQIGRNLTSTLELGPLLDQILKGATEILNCEAGSLFLVDKASGELVFEVTVGPVAEYLVGQRLPPGAGLVGQALVTGQPMIANDARHSKGWFSEADRKTGFTTRDLLVVPLQIKDCAIGVIEVINKRDGIPFLPEDCEILAAFASQAAIAVENARLYTQTDRALAARVEELSVLQHIDQELNASLDVGRALQITLEWALRQTGAETGLAGIVEESGIRFITAVGISLDNLPSTSLIQLSDCENETSWLAGKLPAIQAALASGQPQRWQVLSQRAGYFAEDREPTRPQEMGQVLVVLPVRRGEQVIGLLLLESGRSQVGSEEDLAFLTRLCDHAAITLANAQLYTQVQEANQAKSEFVSFVSHELKTPMTSIKGYSDLLASGAAGPVNDIQSNFLNTIRSNVIRMSTLVSDLSDISRIESGRLHLDCHAVQVDEVIDEVIRAQETQVQVKEQLVELEPASELPKVWSDPVRLNQILTNLVSNAIKYTPQGGRIVISTELMDHPAEMGLLQAVHIAVRDSGYGISTEDQERIFQKFFRSEDQNIRESPGTGLGLNITRYLVEMQGGNIWFESELDKGSTFHFTLPIAPQEG